MSQIREIKCPHCGEWTLWNGNVDDRCLYCDAFIEPNRFSRDLEKKITNELIKENDYFYIKPGDGPFKRSYKRFFNSFRWFAYYVQLAVIVFVTIILIILSLLPG